MIRGTTPVFSFGIPYEETEIDALSIAFAQKRNVVVEKLKGDCTFSDGKVVCELSQDESLRFADTTPTEIQIKIKLNSGRVVASKIFVIETKRILKGTRL